jgi:hypothetical protein
MIKPKQCPRPWRRPDLRLVDRNSATNALAARAKHLSEATSISFGAAMAKTFADPDNRDLVIQASYES